QLQYPNHRGWFGAVMTSSSPRSPPSTLGTVGLQDHQEQDDEPEEGRTLDQRRKDQRRTLNATRSLGLPGHPLDGGRTDPRDTIAGSDHRQRNTERRTKESEVVVQRRRGLGRLLDQSEKGLKHSFLL